MRTQLRSTLAALSAAALIAGGITMAHADDKEEGPRPSDVVKAAPEADWRTIDPDNLLLMDLPTGVVAIELRPDFAPGHVARIRELVKAGFYDGLNFHRVIEGFVAQGGDPKGDGTGGSDKPDLKAEFSREKSEVRGFAHIGRDRMAAQVGFIDGMPVATAPDTLRSFSTARRVDLWGAHCPGVMSMARATNPNSANSQFFLMMGDARQSLDRRYTVWGRIVDGTENARRINRGEPPVRPTPIVRMRIASDVPNEERPVIEVLDTNSDSFDQYLLVAGKINNGLVRDLCAITVPTRVNGKIEL